VPTALIHVIPVVSIKYPPIKIQSTNFRDKKRNYMVAALIFILTKSASMKIYSEISLYELLIDELYPY